MQDPFYLNDTATEVQRSIHILSGSFRSLSLFLLAFSPTTRTIQHVQTISAFGPHQYLAADARKNHVYTTSWTLPPSLSSWQVDRELWRVQHINTVPITAVSSYINIPPPYTYAYSAGGPTGEAHQIDRSTGALGDKIQEILFVSQDELESADKTRVALRYGSHGVEFSSSGYAFIPVLGTDSIEMYERDPSTGNLKHVSSNSSPRGPGANDGPRHVKIHPNGKVLYCVTEHTNYLDVYLITPLKLTYVSSRPLLPSQHASSSNFRGDTLLLTPSSSSHPSPTAIFATTRGSTTNHRGWLSIFDLDDTGMFGEREERWETPTSGGKANAIDLLTKSEGGASNAMWVLLTDDDDHAASLSGGGGVKVLEWNGWASGGVKVVDVWPRSGENEQIEWMQGGSHAIWLD